MCSPLHIFMERKFQILWQEKLLRQEDGCADPSYIQPGTPTAIQAEETCLSFVPPEVRAQARKNINDNATISITSSPNPKSAPPTSSILTIFLKRYAYIKSSQGTGAGTGLEPQLLLHSLEKTVPLASSV